MKVLDKGEDPELAVVACVHGDEVCGRKAIEKFLDRDPELSRPVRFVIANEEAVEEGERFIDTDLNRCFPGSSDSDLHEERLACKLREELESCRCLVLHSMEGFEELFCLTHGFKREMVESTGVEKAVDVEPLGEESLDKYLDSVSVETGERGSEQAVENSVQVIRNFLRYFDALEGGFEISDLQVFEMYEAVKKPEFEFKAENFSLVTRGEVYAEKEGQELRAENDFYPVLMGGSYSNILGFKGRRVEK